MTTIATDGKCVAFDGRACGNYILRSDSRVKAREVAPGIIAAGCGDFDDTQRFMEWVRDGLGGADVERPALGEGFGGIVLDVRKGVCFQYNRGLYAMEVLLPFAIGSGDELAIGAMHAGKHPMDAVKIAALRDVHTGGAVGCLPARAMADYEAAAHDRIQDDLVKSGELATMPPTDTLASRLVVPMDLDILTRDFWRAIEPWFDNVKESGKNFDTGDRMVRSAPINRIHFDHTNELRKKIGALLVQAGLMDGDTDP